MAKPFVRYQTLVIVCSLFLTRRVKSFHIPATSIIPTLITSRHSKIDNFSLLRLNEGIHSEELESIFNDDKNWESSASSDNRVDNLLLEEWDHEETLMAVKFCSKPGVSSKEFLSKITDYTQSFPFAALLPVQPLQYLPTQDGGVEIKFLRKKTQTKSGTDGGVRFFVSNGKDNNNSKTINITVKRCSKGQTISKMFTEKLLIQGFLNGIKSGTENNGDGMNNDSSAVDKFPKTRIESPTKRLADIESIYHKWMQ